MLPHGSQSLMTKIKAALVNGDFLAFLCYSCGENLNGITYTGDTHETAQRRIVEQRQSLWMMMRCQTEAVVDAREQGHERFEASGSSIESALRSAKAYPWEELCMLRPPKFISDIVESVLGAIFVDSDGDLEPCNSFLERIGLMKYLRRIVSERINVTHPKERLNQLFRGRNVDRIWEQSTKSANLWNLKLVVDDRVIAIVSDCYSTDEAIIRATNMACKHIEGKHGDGCCSTLN